MKTILVVDDELANAEVLSLILEDEGYRVFRAANGRDGLDRMAEVKPDLVVLDFMMPILSGTEMGKALRASEAWRHVKIVMNSTLGEDIVREQFTDYDVFLRKPYNVDLAIQAIAQLLPE